MSEFALDMEDYPDDIIPKSSWVMKIDIEGLLSDNIYAMIVRRLDGEENQLTRVMNGQRFITQCAMDQMIDPDLSMSLLGGGFLLENHVIRPRKEIDIPWNGQNVDKNTFTDQIVKINPAYPAVYYVYDLHNREVPYNKGYNKEKDAYKTLNNNKIIDRIKDIFPENKQIQYLGRTQINHKPTQWNYWHVTLNYSSAEDPEKFIENDKKTWEKEMIKSAVRFYLEEIHNDDLTNNKSETISSTLFEKTE